MNRIKFLAISLMALVLSGGVAIAYDQPTYTTYNELRNAGGRQSEPVRVLKLVRNPSRDTTATGWISVTGIQSGDAVRYDCVSDDGVTVGYSVVTSRDTAFAGIACTLIPSADAASSSALDDIGRRNWGWIVVHGPADANVKAGGTNGNAAGGFFITSRDFGTITGIEGANSADVSASAGKGGFFLDAADGTSTTVQVFVQAE